MRGFCNFFMTSSPAALCHRSKEMALNVGALRAVLQIPMLADPDALVRECFTTGVIVSS